LKIYEGTEIVDKREEKKVGCFHWRRQRSLRKQIGYQRNLNGAQVIYWPKLLHLLFSLYAYIYIYINTCMHRFSCLIT